MDENLMVRRPLLQRPSRTMGVEHILRDAPEEGAPQDEAS
jgi:hypothetical protein